MEIKFENVDFAYDKINYKKCEILNDINLQFKKGMINGIVGKSGSGKTTLIELSDALLIPTNGKIKIGDYIIEKDKKINNLNDIHFHIGYVFECPEEEFFGNTVKAELAFGMEINDFKTSEIETRVKEALMMVGLKESYLDKNPFELSNGEKRLVAIASALIYNPDILILDEPTIGLDTIGKKNLIKIIRTLKKRYGKTIIIVTHDIDMLHSIADYIFVLNDKKIVMEGTKYDIFKEEDKLKKYDISCPKIIEFSNLVLKKKQIKIGYRDDINDLIKDIYRYVK